MRFHGNGWDGEWEGWREKGVKQKKFAKRSLFNVYRSRPNLMAILNRHANSRARRDKEREREGDKEKKKIIQPLRRFGRGGKKKTWELVFRKSNHTQQQQRQQRRRRRIGF